MSCGVGDRYIMTPERSLRPCFPLRRSIKTIRDCHPNFATYERNLSLIGFSNKYKGTGELLTLENFNTKIAKILGALAWLHVIFTPLLEP